MIEFRCDAGTVRIDIEDWLNAPEWGGVILNVGDEFTHRWGGGGIPIPPGSKLRLTNTQQGSGSVAAELYVVISGHPANT